MLACAAELKVDSAIAKVLDGAVFEVRQGYKSKDSKRQNADLANAATAYTQRYLPVVLLLSAQIDNDLALRYTASKWAILRGTVADAPTRSTYVFCKTVLGFDLAGFFKRHSPTVQGRDRSGVEGVVVSMKQRADLTFKHNRGLGRHGWLRLTPAYSVKLVGEILGELDGKQVVIEPFSGTGTTAVVSAEQVQRVTPSISIILDLAWRSKSAELLR